MINEALAIPTTTRQLLIMFYFFLNRNAVISFVQNETENWQNNLCKVFLLGQT